MRQSDNSLKAPPGLFATLSELSDRYELRKKDGLKLVFAGPSQATPGRLVRNTEPHGESVTLTYVSGKLSTISTPLAGTVTLTRDAQGRVIQVTRVRDALSYAYTYDASGNLSTSADFDGNTTRYEYTGGLLSALEDPLHRRTLFTYYGDGRATRRPSLATVTENSYRGGRRRHGKHSSD